MWCGFFMGIAKLNASPPKSHRWLFVRIYSRYTNLSASPRIRTATGTPITNISSKKSHLSLRSYICFYLDHSHFAYVWIRGSVFSAESRKLECGRENRVSTERLNTGKRVKVGDREPGAGVPRPPPKLRSLSMFQQLASPKTNTKKGFWKYSRRLVAWPNETREDKASILLG